MIHISPSVLACDFSKLGQEAADMQSAGADLLHLDVMDGHFVPNLSFGAPVVAALRPRVSCPFDVHLMISEPLRYIDDFAKAGADLISFHLESESDPEETLDRIRGHQKKTGLALKPATPAEAVFPFLPLLDMVLVMTVEPGFGGQKFMADMLPKIESVRREIARQGLCVDLEVDGGIDPTTAPLVTQSGANVLVAGSALFGTPDYAEAIRGLRSVCRPAVV